MNSDKTPKEKSASKAAPSAAPEQQQQHKSQEKKAKARSHLRDAMIKTLQTKNPKHDTGASTVSSSLASSFGNSSKAPLKLADSEAAPVKRKAHSKEHHPPTKEASDNPTTSGDGDKASKRPKVESTSDNQPQVDSQQTGTNGAEKTTPSGIDASKAAPSNQRAKYKEMSKQMRKNLREKKLKAKKNQLTLPSANRYNAVDHPALLYVRQWKQSPETWKFQKVRQVYLLKHLYDLERIPDADFPVVLDYLNGLQGRARTETVEQARDIAEGRIPVPTSAPDETSIDHLQREAQQELNQQGKPPSASDAASNGKKASHVASTVADGKTDDNAAAPSAESSESGSDSDADADAESGDKQTSETESMSEETKRQLERANKIVQLLQ